MSPSPTDPEATSPPADTSRSLALLSWNLALLARSAEAPLSWEQAHTEAAVREVVLSQSPEMVLFQELPGLVPYVETHDLLPVSTRSHSGHLAVLVGNELVDQDWSASSIDGTAILVTSKEHDLTIANVHLAPGTGATATRLAQFGAIVDACTTKGLVILGDTNTRTDEIDAIERLGLRASRPPGFTWDSYRNRFHGGPEFRALFTRCFTGGTASVVNQEIIEGRVEHHERRFHLSDHFGLRVELTSRIEPSGCPTQT